MDADLEVLESIISDHFGRTPASTPVCSQTLEVNDESDVDTSSYADICQGRVRYMASENIDASDDNDREYEDDQIDGRSLHEHQPSSAASCSWIIRSTARLLA
ncbi:hypothetical protein DPMN_014685 [Dreissena polymorpha]|uniref:Uncharacterized protein n=1 Tax=Dreissena polymorpha TaxID=45954 RepID=A0A9D4N7S7_DREPO|nr:hypothetical protein DPMN_014685 [Dreissena polymorpha]